ncbi:MAG TPA: gluconate 2-dehydrogenase subunit 3 family protein [Bryobacteraceae bacterium]|nr:gluconate 2-dehydrogenase subunit 3 family protein [Bryobacteraceae bacterium]
MKRRDLLKIGASAAAVPAALAQQHAPTAAIAPQAAWTPQLFDAHQNETVIALTERIIPATDTPGAKLALVNRHLDKLLHDGPAADQQRFLEGLAWLDGQAIRQYGKPFVRCSESEQVAMLQAMDTGSGPGNQFFRLAKSLTSSTYYATEIGFKELNKGGRVPSSFACKESGHA